MTTTPNDRNREVIEEFRANGGNVGGAFAGAPVLLLTTTGARSGRRHTIPLRYLPDGGRMIIFASNQGAPASPDWYHNLVAHPHVCVEVGTETVDVTALVVKGEERDRLYATQAARHPVFAGYQQKTSRTIPVVALLRRQG